MPKASTFKLCVASNEVDHSWIGTVSADDMPDIIADPHHFVRKHVFNKDTKIGVEMGKKPRHDDVTVLGRYSLHNAPVSVKQWKAVISGVERLSLLLLDARQSGTNPPVPIPGAPHMAHITLCPDVGYGALHFEPKETTLGLMREFIRCALLDPAGMLQSLNDEKVVQPMVRDMPKGTKVTIVPPHNREITVCFIWTRTRRANQHPHAPGMGIVAEAMPVASMMGGGAAVAAASNTTICYKCSGPVTKTGTSSYTLQGSSMTTVIYVPNPP